ncbi:MAG TPA: hypothetical protein VKS43_00705 [Burkholderiales bacterium]|nr:hypothetical protein [Burkholderiales bacterium]
MLSARALAASLLFCFFSGAMAQAPAPRIRGAIEKFDAGMLTIKQRDGGTIAVKVGDKVGVTGVVAAPLSDVRTGKFIGTATLGSKDGALVALEVLIFPDAMRGAGEGHYAWDLKPESMMTNANIEGLVSDATGRRLMLRYKGGEQTVLVPEGTPIVTFVDADASALKPGAHVFISRATREADGSISAARVAVGLDGLIPPM